MVLDLTLARTVQVIQAIGERRDGQQDLRLRLVEWQTKILASFMANLAHDEKSAKALLKAARDLRLRAPDPDVPVEDRAPPGSFEKLRAGFGG